MGSCFPFSLQYSLASSAVAHFHYFLRLSMHPWHPMLLHFPSFHLPFHFNCKTSSPRSYAMHVHVHSSILVHMLPFFSVPLVFSFLFLFVRSAIWSLSSFVQRFSFFQSHLCNISHICLEIRKLSDLSATSSKAHCYLRSSCPSSHRSSSLKSSFCLFPSAKSHSRVHPYCTFPFFPSFWRI